jgi:multiple antibiotic resistance protein
MVTAALSDLARDTLLVVGALFPIVNPIGNTPIFLSLTRGLSEDGRTALAKMIALNSLTLILASIFIGTHILAFFGISLPVVQVGGGLIVISTGWALLRQPNDDTVEEDGPSKGKQFDCARQSFYPLTLPLTVGPGAISVAVTVGASLTEHAERYWPLLVGMILGSALISASIYLSYRFAQRIERTIGISAMDVIIRISSFILVCIGVQILWNGLATLLRTVIS